MLRYIALFCCFALLGHAELSAKTTIVRTRANHRTEPIGLESGYLMLSWNLNDDVRGTLQVAYRIQVATSPELLGETTDHADQWDTGWLEGYEMIEIPYQGKPLASSTKYYWTVSVKNNRGETSTLETPATFVTGIVDDADWKAKWVSMNRKDSDPMPIFRKSFTAAKSGKTIKTAIMHICGLGHYELRLNGQKVGNSFIDPGWTNYKKTCLYSSYDVTSMIRSGENVFGVLLGNGMYNVPGGRYVKFKGTFGMPKLIGQLDILYDDGTRETIATDETWRCAFGPLVFSCVYGGEDFDATKIEPGWDAPNFDDSNWAAIQTVDGPGGVLRAQEAPPITVAETLKPEAVKRLDNGQYIADFGYNFSGRPRILLRGKAGSKVTVKTGELADRIWEGHSYTYTLTGTGKNLPVESARDLPGNDATVEILLPKFSYFGFQFLRIDGAVLDADRTDADKDKPILVSVLADFTTSSAERVGTFHCSNEMINEIDAMIDRSVRSNLQSVLTDCPHREKLGWLEVTHLMGPSIMGRFDVQNLYRKICRDTTESQLENGLVPDIAPEYTRFSAGFFESPEWGSASVILPIMLNAVYGDKQIIAQQYETMKRYTDYLASTRNEQGLVKAGLGDWYDWSPEKGHAGYSQHTPGELTATVMLCMDTAILLHTAKFIADNKADSAKYAKLLEQVRSAYQKAYVTEDGIITPNSQAALTFSFLFGLCNDEFETVFFNLVKLLEKNEYAPTTGEVAFVYLLRSLSAMQRHDIIWNIITRTDKPGYGYMLKKCGMKTLSETWDGPGSSMNHCMFGHAQEWFTTKLLGIKFDNSEQLYCIFRPKFYSVDIRPIGDLTSAKGYWLAPEGKIEVTWKIINDRLKCRITVPVSTPIVLNIGTTGGVETATLDGVPLDNNAELLPILAFQEEVRGPLICDINANEKTMQMMIGSGTYDFETEWKPEAKK